MSSLKKSPVTLKSLSATGIAALSSLVFASASWADTPKVIEGQALVRWHTYALSQGLSAPSDNKESNPFRKWAASVVSSRLQKTFKAATLKRVYPNVGWALVEFPKSVKTDTGVSMLRTAFGSGNAVPNTVTKLSSIPNDADYGQQWWTTKIKAPFAWDASTGSPNVVVAVLDTGSQLANPDLQPNLWKNPGEIPGDNIDNDGNGYIDDVYGLNTVYFPEHGENERGMAPNDTEGHGTHVAGIIGAVGNNGTGIAGVNWNVRIMSLRFIGDSGEGSEDGVLEAIDYVLLMKKRGVNIRLTNNSWSSNHRSPAIEDAFTKLNSAKILNICAAGNGTTYYNGSNNDSRPNYPASFSSTGVISVAATTQNDSRATFSNYGAKSVDLAAPGEDILSLGLTPTDVTMSGTSMAAPVVTGAAALLLSTQPNLSVSQLRSKLLACVDKIPALNKVVATGGRLNLARLMGQSRVTINGQTYFKATVGKTKVTYPLAGVEVRAVSTKIGTRTTYTDVNGAFTFADLPLGSYTFTPVLSGYKFSSKRVTLSDKTYSPLMFEATEPSKRYSISGHAYDANNNPVSGVNIFLGTSSTPIAVTDSQGSYSINYRAQGTYTLRAESPNTEWIASSSSISVPATIGASVPNAIVDFNVQSSDNNAPAVSITSPISASYSSSQATASGTATDETNVDKLYFMLGRTVNNEVYYYNWANSSWTSNFSDEGTIKELSQSGQSVDWNFNLPSQVNGDYTLMAWGKDTYGNETAIGAETLTSWTVSSSSVNSASIGASSTSKLSIRRN